MCRICEDGKSRLYRFGLEYYIDKEKEQTRKEPTMDTNTIKAAEQCLIDNGIEPDEVQNVLQALGYILLDEELYED